MYIKSSLETYTRDKEEYYRVRKVNTKIVIGDAWIKLVAKNPSLQFAGIYFLSSLLVLILFYPLFFISSFVFWFFFLLLSFSNLVFLSLICFLLVSSFSLFYFFDNNFFTADAIANFVNQDTRTVLDAIAPLVADTTNQLIRVVGSQILATVKASDWLPS